MLWLEHEFVCVGPGAQRDDMFHPGITRGIATFNSEASEEALESTSCGLLFSRLRVRGRCSGNGQCAELSVLLIRRAI